MGVFELQAGLDEHSNHRDFDETIARCAQGFSAWSQFTPKQRLARLLPLRVHLQNAEKDFIRLAAHELGASADWIRLNIELSCAQVDQLNELVEPLTDTSWKEGDTHRVTRRPAGVVLGIAPWNAPITLAIRAVLSALMCGNTAVLVSSNICPQLHTRVVQVFRDAGIGEDILGLIHTHSGDPQFLPALISHPAVRRINFTGSSRVGRLIAAEAARHLKPCVLELSGKAPMIVLPDSDHDAAISAATYGAFFNQGQICMSTERLLVVGHPDPSQFNAECARRVTELATDRREALGSIVNAEATTRLMDLIEDARVQGAEILAGGERQGTFISPTLITGVHANMRIYHEEIFGPILILRHVDDIDEAVFFANDTDYGLAASVFADDVDEAMKIADRIECGIVQINGSTVFDSPNYPFGGLKASGYGRLGGTAVIEEFTELRWYGVHDPRSVAKL